MPMSKSRMKRSPLGVGYLDNATGELIRISRDSVRWYVTYRRKFGDEQREISWHRTKRNAWAALMSIKDKTPSQLYAMSRGSQIQP